MTYAGHIGLLKWFNPLLPGIAMNSTTSYDLIDSVKGSPNQRLFGFGIFGLCLLIAAVYVGVQLNHDLTIIPAGSATSYFLSARRC